MSPLQPFSFQKKKSFKKLPKEVIKRSGNKEEFNLSKILKSVSRSFDHLNKSLTQEETNELITHIVAALNYASGKDHKSLTVEQIQDIVELELISNHYVEEARAYMIYRSEQEKIRNERPIPEEVDEAFKEAAKYFPNEIQQFQFYDKYSRYDLNLGRRETWIETVDRSVNFLKKLSKNKLDESIYSRIREAILNLEIMPSMRLLAMAGTSADRNNISIYNCSYLPVDSIDSFSEGLLISMNGTGVGFSVERHNIEKLPRVARQTNEEPISYLIEDSTEGWFQAFKLGLETWFSGKDILFDYSVIRPAGSPLKIKGGRASGPEPLKSLLRFTKDKILSRQGGILSSLDAHDIMCKMGEVVVMGGVRRCLPANYEAQLSDGSWKKIKDIQPNVDKVLFNGESFNVQDLYHNGKDQTLRILTAKGYVESTPRHKWLTKNKVTGEIAWVEARLLNNDHYLISPKR